MLSLCLRPESAIGGWRSHGLLLEGPGGRIEVLDHPMVWARGIADGSTLGLLVLERPHPGLTGAASLTLGRGGPGELAALRRQANDWPLHWFWLEWDGQVLSIESSALPTVPLYLVAANGEARADWNPHRLLPFARPRLHWEAAAYFLCTFAQPFSPVTMLEDVQHLAGGYRALWRAGDARRWQLLPPRSVAPDYPRALRQDADPVHRFGELVAAATIRLAGARGRVAAGLSGGLDSTLICATLARGGLAVDSYGILMPDDCRATQIERRNAVVRHYGLADHVEEIPPGYSPWAGTGCRRLTWEELYYSPFEALYRRAAADGNDVFLTGLGGNDLLEHYWDELPGQGEAERARLEGEQQLPAFLTARVRDGHAGRTAALNDLPRGIAQRSVLDSVSAMAAHALRHGLWPVHPLAAPEVVRYAHALPAAWRRERRLMRELLSGWGLPACVTHPVVTESFEGVFTAAMRHCPEFARLLKAPRLADLGLVEPGEVAQGFALWAAGGYADTPHELSLVAIATLESMLEAM